jgi:HEAT repeats
MSNQEIDALLAKAGAELDKTAVVRAQMAVTEKNPQALRLILHLVDARDLDSSLRAAALRLLAAFPAPDVQDRLLRLISEEIDSGIRIGAASLLGQIGGDRILGSLEKIAERDRTDAERVIKFAHVLISHRHHVSTRFLSLPRQEEALRIDNEGQSFQGGELEHSTVMTILNDLAQTKPSLVAPSQQIQEFICAKTRSAFVLSKEVVANGLSAELRHPSVAGIVVRFSADHERWYTARVVLAGPADNDRVYIAIFRRDGVLDLYGTGSLKTREFEIFSAPRAGGTAIRGQGYWHGGRLAISGISGKNKMPGHRPVIVNAFPASRNSKS